MENIKWKKLVEKTRQTEPFKNIKPIKNNCRVYQCQENILDKEIEKRNT